MPDLEVLPRTYRGPVPEWPLGPPASEREAQLWAEMWQEPQAAVWAEYQLARQVGVHVRTLFEIESGRQGSAMRRVARSQAVSLLLTPASLRRGGYRVSPVEAVE